MPEHVTVCYGYVFQYAVIIHNPVKSFAERQTLRDGFGERERERERQTAGHDKHRKMLKSGIAEATHEPTGIHFFVTQERRV